MKWTEFSVIVAVGLIAVIALLVDNRDVAIAASSGLIGYLIPSPIGH